MSQHYRKTGASFSEALGAAPGGAVTADRLIHAIDGLRKAQDEDKTGSKGVVSALKEPRCLLGKGLRRDPGRALPWGLREGMVPWYQAGGASR